MLDNSDAICCQKVGICQPVPAEAQLVRAWVLWRGAVAQECSVQHAYMALHEEADATFGPCWLEDCPGSSYRSAMGAAPEPPDGYVVSGAGASPLASVDSCA